MIFLDGTISVFPELGFSLWRAGQTFLTRNTVVVVVVRVDKIKELSEVERNFDENVKM